MKTLKQKYNERTRQENKQKSLDKQCNLLLKYLSDLNELSPFHLNGYDISVNQCYHYTNIYFNKFTHSFLIQIYHKGHICIENEKSDTTMMIDTLIKECKNVLK